jgi:hypothetical protein
VPAPTPTRSLTPGPEHTGDTDGDRSSNTSKADSSIGSDPKGRKKPSFIVNLGQKFYHKSKLALFSDKDPQVPEESITDLVTPLANIGESLLTYRSRYLSADGKPASNIDAAVEACKAEKSEEIQSLRQMKMIKESINDGYCDISGNIDDLSLRGKLGALSQSLRPQVTVSKVIWRGSKYISTRV